VDCRSGDEGAIIAAALVIRRSGMGTAYFFNLPYHGHINPCLPIMQALARRGEHVVCYGPDEFRRPVESTGATFRAFNYHEERPGVGLMVLAEWQVRVTEQCMSRLVADARAEHPDYLVIDYACLWGRCLARSLRRPAAVVHSTAPTPYSYALAARITLRELRKSPELRRMFVKFLQADRRLARAWKLPRIGVPFNLVAPRYGELHLVLTDRELSPNSSSFDRRYVFLGPCVRPPGCSHGESLPQFDDRPLIYVSLGTFWNKRPDFFRACVDAFRNASVQVLISLGTGVTSDALGALPPHISVRTHVDQIEVLRRTSMFVTHGGMNSICEAALAGVPMLVFPQAVDQFSQARYIAAQGAGIALTPAEITPQALRAAAERILSDPAMRARSREIGLRLRKNGGAEQAADLILNLPTGTSCSFATAGTRPH
jgi:MGT family glycosyltransferase